MTCYKECPLFEEVPLFERKDGTEEGGNACQFYRDKECKGKQFWDFMAMQGCKMTMVREEELTPYEGE
jgi:hypothetical protein